MKKNMHYKLTVAFLFLFIISGCQTAYMTGISKAVLIDKEERSFNNYVEDTIILAQLKNEYFSNNENIFFQVSVDVIEGRVMLTGIVEQIDERIEATKLAWGIKGVNEVINEIQISNDEGVLDYADDLVMKTKINAKLLLEKNILNLNYSVEVVNGIVYLIGIAQDQKELDAVTEISKNTYGVINVISYVRLKDIF
ncbi:BON domain-containing protein [Pelagibacterales bacterium]|nr:BON domain-containing protein [Pelagibacterales bacterium]MDB9986068.1 BON domain-containing protein [Pelagibacterales bacterium]